MAAGWHLQVKPGLPTRCQTHLLAVFAAAKTCQPGAPVRRADGHNMMNAGFSFHGLQPGPHRQATHRMANDKRR